MDIKKKDIDIIKEFKYIGNFCCGGLGCGERFSKFEQISATLVYTSVVLKRHLSNNCCYTCYTTYTDLDTGLKLKKFFLELVNIDSSNIPRPRGKNSWLICTCTIFYQTVLLCPHNLYLEAFNNLKLNSLYRSKLRTLRIEKDLT